MLVVCTANVCRSPLTAGLLTQRLGPRWIVTSAGTTDFDVPIDPHTVAVAAAAGIDLSRHRRRLLDRAVLTIDGADLVLTMTRAQVRAVVDLDPGAWPRTFTLKELSRRAASVNRPASDEGLEAWRTRIAVARRASGMVRPDPVDDVADPYGRSREAHEVMVAEVQRHVDVLVRMGPWGR